MFANFLDYGAPLRILFKKLVRVRKPFPIEMGDGGPGQESGLCLLPRVVYEQESIGKGTSDELSVSLTWGKCI